MFSSRIAVVGISIVLTVAVAGCGSSSARPTATPTAAAKQTPTTTGGCCALTVNITEAASTVWGTVTVTGVANTSPPGQAINHTCNQVTCTFMIPKNTKLTLHQTETQHSTWPFQKWVITQNGTSKTIPTSPEPVPCGPQPNDIPVNMGTGPVTVSAVYPDVSCP
jgi:hypothetical protein